MEFVILAVVVAVILVLVAVAGLVLPRRRRAHRHAPATSSMPAEAPQVPAGTEPAGTEPAEMGTPGTTTSLEVPEPTAGRLVRLRGRLARSQNAMGRGLLAVLSRDHLDEDAWEEIEDTLLAADMGVAATRELVASLRERVAVLGVRTPEQLSALLRDELLAQVGTGTDRSLCTAGQGGQPAVVLVVGVNGTGKTTTCGKLARVLVADGRRVLLGAADTFRAAAADQLQTWGERVGAETVRGPEGGDPASVAFDAVRRGSELAVDTVLIDTAGRLHTKAGLMDELGKIKRVTEKQAPVTETLLVLDATTGQNALKQASVFKETVDLSGVVLTKLDGSAKGGVILTIAREYKLPVKMVGIGEGIEDLKDFHASEFVDALFEK